MSPTPESRPQLVYPDLSSAEEAIGQARLALKLVEKVFGYDTKGLVAIEAKNTWPSPLFLVAKRFFLDTHKIELDERRSHPNRLVVRVSPSLSGGSSIEILRERGLLALVGEGLAAEKNLTVTICRDRDGQKRLKSLGQVAAVSLADPGHSLDYVLPHQAPIQLAVVLLGTIGNRPGRPNEELAAVVAV